MAELSLKQIIDRLNAEFTGDSRKLVFWYDEKAEFAEDIDTIVLENAAVYHLAPDNQFRTKYFLERQDRTTNYLIYAPFPKPDVTENHLEDMLLYSRRFYVDRASLLCVDLGIGTQYKPVIEKHIKFFANKDRTQRFYDLEITEFNQETIEVGLLSVLCKSRVCSFEEVLRIVLTEGDLQENAFLQEFEKYDLTESFWTLCERQFGYSDPDPTLERLVITLFATCMERSCKGEFPKGWKSFLSYKSGNVIAFTNGLMNSVLYRDRFDALSQQAAEILNINSILQEMQPEDLIDCDVFEEIDQKLIQWMIGRLQEEDTAVKLRELSIPAVCKKRLKMHFSGKYDHAYHLVLSAAELIEAADYTCPDGFDHIVEQYVSKDYRLDRAYRDFYRHLDRIEDAEIYETLRVLIENIYANEYLSELLPKWNAGYQKIHATGEYVLQREFYHRRLRGMKEQMVVIISDALRYEVGQELAQRLKDDPKCTDVKLDLMISTLPSYTRLGMAALLPHKTLTMREDYEILADDVLCNDLNSRQSVLQSYEPSSICVQFDDIKNKKKTDLRALLNNQKIIYIYHNQIDARGDKPNTEDEVFEACSEAIEEIIALIHRLSSSANKRYFMVTADHGFLYRRNALTESDKIGSLKEKNAWKNRRFVISEDPIKADGVGNICLGDTLGNDDRRSVSFPIGAEIFKVPGGGQNFVHGGSSPQEMLIPLLQIRMEKAKVETSTAQIALVSIVNKITNLVTQLDFIQTEAVCDTVKAATYRLYFISETDEKVSDEQIFAADRRDEKRIARLRFTFRNQQYYRNMRYYLVVVDQSTGVESWRHEVIIDMAFAGDFGFGF